MLRFILSANHLSFTIVKQRRRFRWNSCPSGHRKVTWGSPPRGLRYRYGSFNYPDDTNLWTRRILHQSLYKWKGILRVSTFCYLGTEVHENFNWMTEVNSSCYGPLYWRSWITLTLIMAKHSECLILSKIDYSVLVSDPIPVYLFMRFELLQLAAANFVLGRYAIKQDLLKLGWIPVVERKEQQE